MPILFALSWDPTISAGNVLSGVMMLGGLLLGFIKIRERLIAIETQLGPLWTEYNDRRREIRRAEDRP